MRSAPSLKSTMRCAASATITASSAISSSRASSGPKFSGGEVVQQRAVHRAYRLRKA
jgi:hypothetical protein